MDQITWLKQNTGSLLGKTVVLSGATGGLGHILCHAVLFCGGDLVLLNRNEQKTQALHAALKREFPDRNITCLTVDLAEMDSVHKAVENLKTMPVDVLIHNAGAYSIPRRTCSSGYGNVFQINFVSPYYMTRELLPLLRRRHGKVVAVGSIAHNYSKSDPNDVDFSTRKAASLVYGNSKRYLMFALMGLLRGSGVEFAIGHPGITFTNITAHYPKLVFAVIRHPMKVIFMKPASAARSIIRAVFEPVPDQHWIGPAILNIWGHPRIRRLRTCSAAEQARICSDAETIWQNLTKCRS